MKKTVLGSFRPAFFPSLEYFWHIAQCDVAVFADHLQYTKGSSINRSAPLYDTNDILRIPVRHNGEHTGIFNKQIDLHSPWRQKHLKTIRHLFHNFPFAYYYLPELEELYGENFRNLGDFLWRLTERLVKWLHLPVKLLRSSKLGGEGCAEELIFNWCKLSGATFYIGSAEAFKNKWADQEKLDSFGIGTLLFAPLPESHLLQNYASLSIIHYLLQFGPEGGYIIRQYLSQKRRPA